MINKINSDKYSFIRKFLSIAEKLDNSKLYRKSDRLQIKFAQSIQGEWWIKDHDIEYADGDNADADHTMIAEDYILNTYIRDLPDMGEGLVSKEVLNSHSTIDDSFIEFLENKYNYTQEDAIDNAYSGNYIRWLMTGDDTAETPLIAELFKALADPRKYAIENYGWIRVQRNYVDMRSLNDEDLENLAHGLHSIFSSSYDDFSYEENDEDTDPLDHYLFSVETHTPVKYFTDVSYEEIRTGKIRDRLKSISDPVQVQRKVINPAFPAYKYTGGSNNSLRKIPEPGELPIPEGTSRRFHYTKTDDLDSLRNEGLKLDKSESWKYGDPRAIWSSPGFPNWIKPVVEYWEHPKNLVSDTYQFNDVSPDQILAIHEPWHESYRYVMDHFGLDDAIKRVEEIMPMEKYEKVLERLKEEKSKQ